MSSKTKSVKAALRSHVLKGFVILVVLLGIALPGKAQTTTITATFKTPSGLTPAAANLKPITTVNGTQVYGTAEFDPYDLSGNRSTRIVCGGITFLPQSVRGWIRGDGALVDSSALEIGRASCRERV